MYRKNKYFHCFFSQKPLFFGVFNSLRLFCNPVTPLPRPAPPDWHFSRRTEWPFATLPNYPPKFAPGSIFPARPTNSPRPISEVAAVAKIQPPEVKPMPGFQTLAKWQFLKPYHWWQVASGVYKHPLAACQRWFYCNDNQNCPDLSSYVQLQENHEIWPPNRFFRSVLTRISGMFRVFTVPDTEIPPFQCIIVFFHNKIFMRFSLCAI